MKLRASFKKLLIFFLFIGYCSISNGQSLQEQKEFNEAFNTLIKYFKDSEDRNMGEFLRAGIVIDSVNYHFNPPVLWKSGVNSNDDIFTLEVSDNPIALEIKEIVLENPYGDKFPVSYSVIYEGRLISLFESGRFVCHSISSMQRDLSFEKKINTKNFKYHWIVNNKLVGLSKGKYYYLNTKDKWQKYKEKFPLIDQPKLFEDDSYISFCDSKYEWGGTVYFYNKATGEMFFTKSTDANTIYVNEGKYYILSELGHIGGNSALKEISNPELLTPISLEEIRKHPRSSEISAVLKDDKSNASRNVFFFRRIGLYSTFNYKGRTIYLTNLNLFNRAFLAEIENNTVKIVNPLFNSRIFAHRSLTTTYSDAILINIVNFNIERKGEVTCIIIKDDQFIKLDWNKKYH